MDLYELTMTQAYAAEHMDQLTVIELIFRQMPGNRNYIVAAGGSVMLSTFSRTSVLVAKTTRLHMITPPYRIAAFNLGTAAGLVLVTAGIGYIGGWVVGVIWNRCVPSDMKV
jgi:hypothetical protein